MQEFLSREGGGLLWRKNHERIWIAPWGRNGVRVRVTVQALAGLALGVCITNRQRVQPVLRCESIARVSLAQRNTGNAPTQVARGNGSFRGRCHVGAHEGAYAQVHDAGLQSLAVIGRAGHGGGQGA